MLDFSQSYEQRLQKFVDKTAKNHLAPVEQILMERCLGLNKGSKATSNYLVVQDTQEGNIALILVQRGLLGRSKDYYYLTCEGLKLLHRKRPFEFLELNNTKPG